MDGPQKARMDGPEKEVYMSALRQRMQEDLELRGYSKATIRSYLNCSRSLAFHYMKSPGELDIDDIRHFLLHLIKVKKIGPAHHKLFIASLKFLYGTTLGRGDIAAMLVYPRVRSKLPDVLSVEEVASLLDAIESPVHRMIVTTLYTLGLRIGEACSLKITDIDSQKMVIHIREAKRGRDRFVMLPENFLTALRSYWALVRPSGPFLFPGKTNALHLDPESVRDSLRRATQLAKVTKRVTPHILRHSFATYLLEVGTDIRVIQSVLGHASIVTTGRYTRISTKNLAQVKTPYDELTATR